MPTFMVLLFIFVVIAVGICWYHRGTSKNVLEDARTELAEAHMLNAVADVKQATKKVQERTALKSNK